MQPSPSLSPTASSSLPSTTTPADGETARKATSPSPRRRSFLKAKTPSNGPAVAAPPPSRPANSFILFRRDFNRRYREQNPEVSTRSQDISLMASKEWAETPSHVRQRYEEMYRVKVREHREQLADYRAANPAPPLPPDTPDGSSGAAVGGPEAAFMAQAETPTAIGIATSTPPARKPSSRSRRKRKSLEAALDPRAPEECQGTVAVRSRTTSPAKKGRRSLDALHPSPRKATPQGRRSRSQSVSSPSVLRKEAQAEQEPSIPVGQAVTTGGEPSLVEGLYKAIGPEKARKLAESLKRRGWTVPEPPDAVAVGTPVASNSHTAPLPSRPQDFGMQEPHITLRSRHGDDYAELQDWQVTSSFSATVPKPSDTAAPWDVFARVEPSQTTTRQLIYYSDPMLEQFGLPPSRRGQQHAAGSSEQAQPMSMSVSAEVAQAPATASPSALLHQDAQHHVPFGACDESFEYLYQQMSALGQQQIHQPRQQKQQQQQQIYDTSAPFTGGSTESGALADLLHAIFPEAPRPEFDPAFKAVLSSFTQPQSSATVPSVQHGSSNSDDWQGHGFPQTATCDVVAYGQTSTTRTTQEASITLESAAFTAAAGPNYPATPSYIKSEHSDSPYTPAVDGQQHLSDEFCVPPESSLLLTQTFEPCTFGPFYLDTSLETVQGSTSLPQPSRTSPPRTPKHDQSLGHRRQGSRGKSPGHKERERRRVSLAVTPPAPVSPPAFSFGGLATFDQPWNKTPTMSMPIQGTGQVHNFSRPLGPTSPPPPPVPAAVDATVAAAEIVKTETPTDWNAWTHLCDLAGWPSSSTEPTAPIVVTSSGEFQQMLANSYSTAAPAPSSHTTETVHVHDQQETATTLYSPQQDMFQLHPVAAQVHYSTEAITTHSTFRTSLDEAMTFHHPIPVAPPCSSVQFPTPTSPTSTLARWASKATKKSRTLLDRLRSPTFSSTSVPLSPLTVEGREEASSSRVAGGEEEAPANDAQSPVAPWSAAVSRSESISVAAPETPSHTVDAQGEVQPKEQTIRLNGEYTVQELLLLAQGRIK